MLNAFEGTYYNQQLQLSLLGVPMGKKQAFENKTGFIGQRIALAKPTSALTHKSSFSTLSLFRSWLLASHQLTTDLNLDMTNQYCHIIAPAVLLLLGLAGILLVAIPIYDVRESPENMVGLVTWPLVNCTCYDNSLWEKYSICACLTLLTDGHYWKTKHCLK